MTSVATNPARQRAITFGTHLPKRFIRRSCCCSLRASQMTAQSAAIKSSLVRRASRCPSAPCVSRNFACISTFLLSLSTAQPFGDERNSGWGLVTVEFQICYLDSLGTGGTPVVGLEQPVNQREPVRILKIDNAFQNK